MRRLLGATLVVVLVSACGGTDGSAQTSQPEPSATLQVDDPDDTPTTTAGDPDDSTTGTDTGGSEDNPSPEGSGPLPANSFRIGDELWELSLDSGFSDCFVGEDAGVPFSVNGSLNNDESLRFSVHYVEEDTFDARVSDDEIFWVAAPMRDGTEVSVEWDVATQTISGTGLFNDSFRGLWAYGSFNFTCGGS